MERNNKIIGRWLLVGVAMLTIQVLLGGITRLTGSGLSMTEWKPIIGMIPPLNEIEWNIAFEKYQQIGQYKFLNQDYSLGDFKFIFFWEWFHRNWAHFIAFAFLFPFVYFLYKRMITKAMIPQLIALFLLGIAQGLIGMIMVASGLNDENIYVNHIKLAIHFISAMILILFTCWFAFSVYFKDEEKIQVAGIQKWNIGILIFLFIQMTYGAFMAGLKAATASPTWPSINGDYFPATLANQSWIHHPINIHFVHRMLAYLICLIIIVYTVKLFKINFSSRFSKYKYLPIILVILQIVLGILSILFSTHTKRNGFGAFEWFAQCHQLVAMLLVMSMVLMTFMFSRKNANA
jgi:heme a synthase